MAAKSIVADLNKGDKLNGDNYDRWHRKVQFLIEEQEVIEAIRNVMVEPSGEGPAQKHGKRHYVSVRALPHGI
ncbi:UBN2_3 domain-containing protein [Senna tora]|uniref:UBN2_3 domain-containing protein n=1 Tax=Senna tora TaxID=362788 RepID=A0A834SE77_9FABA|nr:UBN2_3 domain-containing protein [Senna tora]